jgi:radical SAM protein with 4Fe4S-binding SPASM domain
VKLNQWRDYLAFAGKLNSAKLVNATLVFGSYLYSRWTGRPRPLGLPMSLSVEPTTACNLRCPECPSGLRSFTRPTGTLKESLFDKVLDEVAAHTVAMTFYFQGEPFIHPGLCSMIRKAHKKGIYTIVSTNGHFLDQEQCEQIVLSGLDRLIVSVDGASQEVYETYRKGGELSRVTSGIERLVETRQRLRSGKPYLILQHIVFRQNEDQLGAIKALATQLKVDKLELKTAQVYDYESGSDLIPETEVYARYQKQESGSYHIKNPLLNHCWKMWQGCVVCWDGRVVPCCFDKDANYQMGNVSQRSLSEIWKSNDYQRFRKRILQDRKGIDICTNCTEGGF